MTTSAGCTRYAGSRMNRVEDDRLLRGHGTYVDDIVRPRVLHASFVRSPMARGRIVSIDVAAARELPGVRVVFVAADLNPCVHEQWHSELGPGSPETPPPPLAEDEVRFVGDPVALVVAEDRSQIVLEFLSHGIGVGAHAVDVGVSEHGPEHGSSGSQLGCLFHVMAPDEVGNGPAVVTRFSAIHAPRLHGAREPAGL